MPDHGHDGGTGILRPEQNAGVAVGEDPEYLVGEALSNGSHVAKIENDFAKFVQVRQKTSGFGARDIVGLQELDPYLRLLELEIVLLRSEFAEETLAPRVVPDFTILWSASKLLRWRLKACRLSWRCARSSPPEAKRRRDRKFRIRCLGFMSEGRHIVN